jgi:hypothetical protein
MVAVLPFTATAEYPRCIELIRFTFVPVNENRPAVSAT